MPNKAQQQNSQLIRGFVPYVESKGEEYMGVRMRAHFTHILGQWKKELMRSEEHTSELQSQP